MVMMLMTIMASAKDVKTVVFTTNPIMHCENCENKIKTNLRFEKGVKEITTNVAEQRVTVAYDATKTNEETLRKAFTKFGYEAKIVGCGNKKAGCDGEKTGCKAGAAKCSDENAGCKAGAAESCCKAKAAQSEQPSCCKAKADSKEAPSCCKAKAEKKEGCGGCK